MNKKILIGSMLVLVMLLLMPSIPAVQQKTIEDKAYSDLVERLEDFDFKDLKEIMPLGDDIKHPFLLGLVLIITGFKIIHTLLLLRLSSDWRIGADIRYIEVIYPTIFQRFLRSLESFVKWLWFWDTVSNWFGWNWDI